MSNEILKTQKILSGDEKPIFVGFPNDEYLFQNFKKGFIINNFADNIHFNQSLEKRLRKSEPYAPKINVWTAQPVDSIKTMKHL